LSLLLAIFLGLVWGITEFLPVSGSGHFAILQNLFNLEYTESEHFLFKFFLHLSTLVSVFLVYKNDIKEIFSESFAFLTGKGNRGRLEDGRLHPATRTALMIIIGIIPMIFILPFYGKIKSLANNITFVAFSFIISGALIYVAAKFADGKKGIKIMTSKDSFIIGLAQAISGIPGLSRAGATISVGFARDLKHSFAVKFSFLLYIPIALISALVSLFSAIRNGIDFSNIFSYLIGAVFAGFAGYISIMLIRYFVNRFKLAKLSYYCWAVGILALILSLIL